jgi:hypothetical protein
VGIEECSARGKSTHGADLLESGKIVRFQGN